MAASLGAGPEGAWSDRGRGLGYKRGGEARPPPDGAEAAGVELQDLRVVEHGGTRKGRVFTQKKGGVGRKKAPGRISGGRAGI